MNRTAGLMGVENIKFKCKYFDEAMKLKKRGKKALNWLAYIQEEQERAKLKC